MTTTGIKRTDELPRVQISDSAWLKFVYGTVKEWESILATCAVTIICPREASIIPKEKYDRIVPSRHVYRNKPGEEVGAERIAKVRWCVLGHRDPDIMELARSAPTPQTSSIYTFLLLAATQRELSLVDLKTALMQRDKAEGDRPKGKLYAEIPFGGIPLVDGAWVPEGSLIQPNTSVYGLVNVPLAWRETLVRAIEKIGYRRSCCDPCIFCLMSKEGPVGHIVIEVDDLASEGTRQDQDNMTSLRNIFKFGKCKSIYKEEGDYVGRTIIQRSHHSFKIHQAKFIKERLKPIQIATGRKSMKKEKVVHGERIKLRAVLGGINWVQRETRPDQAGNASIGMSSFLQATVQDLCDANAAVAQLKEDP